MPYDTKCYELADAFLSDTQNLNRPATEQDKGKLAQAIQQCIEDWLDDNNFVGS